MRLLEEIGLLLTSIEEGGMDTKRIVIGTFVGGIVLYATGYLIFELAFGDFYTANAGAATGVARDTNLQWPLALGSLSYAALIALGIANRAGKSTIGAGIMIGAVVGFLIWFTVDFTFFGSTNIANLTRTIVDPLLEIVHGGIGGASVAAVIGKPQTSA
jgi:hypothetical protein